MRSAFSSRLFSRSSRRLAGVVAVSSVVGFSSVGAYALADSFGAHQSGQQQSEQAALHSVSDSHVADSVRPDTVVSDLRKGFEEAKQKEQAAAAEAARKAAEEEAARQAEAERQAQEAREAEAKKAAEEAAQKKAREKSESQAAPVQQPKAQQPAQAPAKPAPAPVQQPVERVPVQNVVGYGGQAEIDNAFSGAIVVSDVTGYVGRPYVAAHASRDGGAWLRYGVGQKVRFTSVVSGLYQVIGVRGGIPFDGGGSVVARLPGDLLFQTCFDSSAKVWSLNRIGD